MKKLLYFFLFAFMMLAWASCDRPDNGDDGKDVPPEPPVSEYYEFALTYSKDSFKASDNGVSVEVKSAEADNVVFNLTPGAAVQSYRMIVYPKALLYNTLLNENCVDARQKECENVLIKLLTDGSTTPYVFNDTVEGFKNKEFDWINTEYANGTLIPDCEYYIVVLGCYDKEALNPASLSICSFTTAAPEIIGNPSIRIEAEVGYNAFVVKYFPNQDCKQFVHWIWTTEELGEYIDLFGDRLMRDFIRCVSGNLDATDELNLAIKRTFDASMDVVPENTAIAVAMDANGTPSSVIVREDFTLLEVPEGNFVPVARMKAGSRISATLAYFDVELEANCMSAFYRLCTAEEVEQIRALSAEEKELLANDLAANGWGVANPNFSFNPNLGTLTGSAFSSSDQHVTDIQPNTSYALIYVAKNYFGELSDLCISETFKTKELVRDNPDACIADVNLSFTEISRWSFSFNFSYDYEKTACYRFQLVWPYEEDDPETDEDDDYIRPPHYINDANDRDKWMTFFFDTFDMNGPAGPVPIVNMWEAERSGRDGINMYGFESGTKYVYAVCAEDINGVVGPVRFFEVTTESPTPGPDPMAYLQDLAFDEAKGEISGVAIANKDTKFFKYIVVTDDAADLYSNCALDDLVNSNRRDYDTYIRNWEKNLMEYGFESYAEYATFSVYADKNSNPILIAAIAVGEKNGLDVYSPLASKIFYKGKFFDLSDFRKPSSN